RTIGTPTGARRSHLCVFLERNTLTETRHKKTPPVISVLQTHTAPIRVFVCWERLVISADTAPNPPQNNKSVFCFPRALRSPKIREKKRSQIVNLYERGGAKKDEQSTPICVG